MPETPVISKKMVAYLKSLLAVAPFRKTTEMKIDTKIDKLYESAMRKLGTVNDANFGTYMERKLRAWYRRYPPKPAGVDSADDAAESGAAAAQVEGSDPADDPLAAVEAPMLSDGE